MLFNDVRKSLRDFPSLPFPDQSFLQDLENRLLSEELGYNRDQMLEEHEKLHRNLNKEQLHAYNCILKSVDSSKGGIFFVYVSGGCENTFL